MWILELSLDDSDDSYWLLLVVNPFFILFSKSLDRKHFHLALAFACTGFGGTRTWMKMEGVETFGDDMIKKPHALRNPSYTYIYIYTHLYIYIVYCIIQIFVRYPFKIVLTYLLSNRISSPPTSPYPPQTTSSTGPSAGSENGSQSAMAPRWSSPTGGK